MQEMSNSFDGRYCIIHGIPVKYVTLEGGITIPKHIDDSPCTYLDSWDPNIGSKYVEDRSQLIDLINVSPEDFYLLISNENKLRSYIMAPFPSSLANIEKIFGFLVTKRMVLPFERNDPIMDEISGLTLYSLIYRGLVPPLARSYITKINQKYIKEQDKQWFVGLEMEDIKLFTGEKSDGSARILLGYFFVTESNYGAFRVLSTASKFAFDFVLQGGEKKYLKWVGKSLLLRMQKTPKDILIEHRSDVASLVHFLEADSVNLNSLAKQIRAAWKEKFDNVF